MPRPLSLYYVTADSPDGDNLDWFVWAPTAQAAGRLWWARLRAWRQDVDADFAPRVRRVPTRAPSRPRVVEWHAMRAVEVPADA